MKFINLILILFITATVVVARQYSDLTAPEKKEVEKLRSEWKVICPALECSNKPIGKLSS